jgi:predicted enzyme related to lactoylglutathione lyase
MEMLKNALSWAEIPASDFDRAKKFYSSIFGFEMPEMMMGPQRLGILLYDQEGGGIGGAILQGEGYVPSMDGPRVYLNGGQDLSVVLGRVEQAGGTVILTKSEIAPGMGYYAFFRDTEGNQVGLHSMG